MSANQQISPNPNPTPTNQSSSTSAWTEPPWSGWIETTGDALLILEAARRGLIPRVTRRLVDSERKMITSGSVFVFDEDESGIKRWTDGFFWSPSRILGNFLLYRETDKRGAGHRGVRSDPAEMNEHSQYNVDGVRLEGQTLSRPKGESSSLGIDKHRERVLVGSLTNSYKFKSDGLMKKTFSLTIGGVSQHLISYYKVEDVEQGRLRSPSSLPELASLDISPEYLDKTHFRNPPKVEIGVDGVPRYRGEADDIESAPSMITAPLSSGLPLLTDGRISDGKRGGRYNPYATGSGKRSRKSKSSQPESTSPTDQHPPPLPSPSTPTASQAPPPPPYPDQPVSGLPPQPHYSAYPTPSYYGVPGYSTSHSSSHSTAHSAAHPPYSGSSYPTPSPTTPHQPSPAPSQPYPYPGYGGASASADTQQTLIPHHPPASVPQNNYYQYYPPPASQPSYGSYPPSSTWPAPTYASYSSPPSGSSNVPPLSASISELPDKPSEGRAAPEAGSNSPA
ncbi:Gti1/Pac2 family-domain-containing protein [Suillus clintonianus]|uniref:Gti1/Pac2 family-domain-containing protein n=1 Tax=Suillus clintonianus TaxID=1904413 RepID=UPI001B85FCDF|nr:Gti1/Pac2 family-domain-containing protein [Suillus clintonianus]KAG2148863.1 Gti1/Pac2 family-domain-containing protein [Suillus clintonianus]